MKIRLVTGLLALSPALFAQDSSGYAQLLASAREIALTDSLRFDASGEELSPLDSLTVIKWFSPVLSPTAVNKFKNRSFSLAGKMTANSHFDLVLLLEEKKKNDSSGIRIIYLISMKKNGDFIAWLEAAAEGMKKKNAYSTNSCLYRDYRIVRNSRILVKNQSLDDASIYRISPEGRFIATARFN